LEFASETTHFITPNKSLFTNSQQIQENIFHLSKYYTNSAK
jgi:hypothetical protein